RAQHELEAALRESAALMHTVNLNAIVSQTDVRGVITQVNDAFTETSGYTAAEVLGCSHNIVKSGQHSSEFWQRMWATIRAGQPWQGEVCNRAKSGVVYWVDTLVAPFVNDQGEIDRFVSICTNITARKVAQQALQKARRDLELSNQAAHIGTWDFDVEHDTMTWSSVSRSIYQVPADFVITRKTALRFFPEGLVRDDARRAMRHARATGQGWDVEQQLVTYAGESLWVRSIGATEMVDGRCVRVYGTFQDVHDRKLRELELERSRHKLQSTIDGTGAATWEWNVQTGETVFNTIWAEMLGYTLDELQPTTIDTWQRFCHPDDLPDAQAALERHFSGERDSYESVIRMQHRDGHWVWVRDTGRVVSFKPDGKPSLMYGTHIDISAFKHAQLEAEAYSRRLKNIIEGTRAGTWEWNLQTGQGAFNDLFAEILGYRPDELPTSAWELLAKTTHPDDFVRSQQALARHWRGEVPYHDFTVRALHKDGHVVWVQDRGRVVERDDSGRAVLMTGIRSDVTELIRAHEEVTEKEHLLTSSLESVGAALAVFDASERLVLANDRFFSMHQPLAGVLRIGITFEEFVTAGLDAGAMRLDEQQRSTWLADRLADFRAGTTDRVIPLQDGTALRVVERRTPEGMTVALRFDVTELENARRTAQHALVRQQAIFEVLPVGITITDPSGNIVDCNPASERLLGISKAEHLSRNCRDTACTVLREDGTIMPPEDHASVRALTSHQAVRDQVMRMQRDDTEVVLSVSAVPVDDVGIGVVAGYVDITDLARAREEAEAASRSKSQFVANMSHEIRTPMNAILGMLHLLQTTPLSARQKDYAQKSESAAKSLLGILNDILDFSKVEAGKMELDPEPFSFDKLVRDLGVIYSSNAKAKQLEL
ncbi:MAG: PAS domain-containing protein, partial [Burkholderiales bacterium]|nr:PAS domain-containing protein [Burkholderiales bacterium]